MNKEQKTALIGSAAILAVVTTSYWLAYSGSNDEGTNSKHTTTVAASKSASPAPSPEPTGPTRHTLKGTAKWDDIAVRLGDFRRGSTNEFGVPEDTPYVRFTVTLTNASADPLGLSEVIVNCATQEIFDSTEGLEGNPEVHVMPSKSLSWDLACAQDKDVKELQVEINPQVGNERTAAFIGVVK